MYGIFRPNNAEKNRRDINFSLGFPKPLSHTQTIQHA